MASRIKLVQGDIGSKLTLSLTSGDCDDAPLNLTGANVLLKFRAEGSTTVIETMVGNLLVGSIDSDGEVDLLTYPGVGQGGRVEFAWTPNAINSAAGRYEGEVEIAYPLNVITQTVYHLLKFTIRAQF